MLGVFRHPVLRLFSLKCCTSTLRPYKDTNSLLEIRCVARHTLAIVSFVFMKVRKFEMMFSLMGG